MNQLPRHNLRLENWEEKIVTGKMVTKVTRTLDWGKGQYEAIVYHIECCGTILGLGRSKVFEKTNRVDVGTCIIFCDEPYRPYGYKDVSELSIKLSQYRATAIENAHADAKKTLAKLKDLEWPDQP